MTDETVVPALSAEEWAIGPDRFGQRLWLFDDTSVHQAPDGTFSVNWDGAVYDQALQPLTSHARHAVAALCLHGQPFGFTRKDVELLRVGNEWHIDDVLRYAESLAARIEALLPPPTTAP